MRRPTLHLICGLPGTGKTTLARELENRHNALRFCPDEWILAIWTGNRNESEGNRFRDEIEQLQWTLARRCLQIGVDVIIEWGTWGRKERGRIRDEAHALGARVYLYYLECDRRIMRERILRRNQKAGRSEFVIPEDEIDRFLDSCFDVMEVPTADEYRSYDRVIT